MIKTLKPVGNSLGLIIDKPILDLLRIDRSTPLELGLEGGRLYIEPVRRDEVGSPGGGQDRPDPGAT